MIKVIYDNENVFGGKRTLMDVDEAKAIKYIANVVKNKPNKLISLLRKYGTNIPDNISAKQLITATIDMFMQLNEQFNYDFAELVVGKKYSNSQHGEAIAQSIGSIGNLFSSFFSFLGAKKDRDLTRDQIEAGVWNKLIGAKESERRRKANIILLISGFAGIAVLMVIFSFTRQPKPIKV